jgi:hypothetical protein
VVGIVGSMARTMKAKRKSTGGEVVEILDEGPRGGGPAGSSDREQESRDYLKKIQKVCQKAEASHGYKGTLSSEEKDKLVGEVMRFMLFKCGQNNNHPVARDKVVGLIAQRYSGKSKHGLPQFIVAEAQASFAKIMGMDMVELEGSSQKYYVLRSILPKRFQDGLKEKKEDRHEKALLLTVLMILSLSGDQILEETLWEHLNLLGVDKDAKHVRFGDVSSLLSKFRSQRYIQRVAKKSDNGRVYFYIPGENAINEIDEVTLNQAISQKLQKGRNVDEIIALD